MKVTKKQKLLFNFVEKNIKMQQTISNKIHWGATLNPLKDVGNVPAVDEESNLANLYSKVDKNRRVLENW